ncbi:penicillin-binding protein [Paenibacillus selenitireducens]|uniref:Penicillin-binding protein n=1 Tax=Paenibacillus selenitireducens TaxID=1324314 RepID=A0A1T2XC41_9BACL|nr:serine hydrolase [Paenibacillus selenitireducens]OPA77395.1 penicillin-binding protein [Paenibacillus selenitireducens]
MGDAMKSLQNIHSFIEQQMNVWKVPGLAVVVIKDQEVIMAEGFGYRDVEEGLRVTPETLFAIGSSTKAFTAMSAGILVDEGKLEWDTPVRTYLPNFKMHDAFATERITIRDMLCHRSGLPRHELMWYNSPLTREEMIERLQYLEPNQDFRSTWQYQNIMYMAAGYFVGQRSNTSWEQVVQDKIFNPLQMNSSNLSVETSQLGADYALPYMDQGDQVQRIPFRNIDTIGPAGSINSNIKDMAKWVMLHLNKGVHQGQQIISEENLATMHAPHMTCGSSGNKERPVCCYGLGWGIEPYRGHHMIHHGGNIDGFSAEVSFLPYENLGIVILSNAYNSPLPMLLTYNIMDRMLGLDEIDWSQRRFDEMKQWKAAESTDDKDNDTADQVTGEAKASTTHTLEDYVGLYEHPGYGPLSIDLIDGNLQVEFNSFQLPLSRVSNHKFELDFKPFGVKTPASFHTDSNGRIVLVSIKLLLEPGAKDIEFIKTGK